MKIRLLALWDVIRTSLWFVPTFMTFGAVGLSFLAISIDRNIERSYVEELGWFYAGGPEGARQMLATIAGSMITVAGVAFSITIVALALASQQFGPRMLRSFMPALRFCVVSLPLTGVQVHRLLRQVQHIREAVHRRRQVLQQERQEGVPYTPAALPCSLPAAAAAASPPRRLLR